MQVVESVSPTEAHFTNGFLQATNQRATHRRGAYLNASDVDSDEEIHRLVAAQQVSHSALQRVSEDDNLEVVGSDYLVKSGTKGDRKMCLLWSLSPKCLCSLFIY